MIEFVLGVFAGLGFIIIVKLYSILLHIDSYKRRWEHERWKNS